MAVWPHSQVGRIGILDAIGISSTAFENPWAGRLGSDPELALAHELYARAHGDVTRLVRKITPNPYFHRPVARAALAGVLSLRSRGAMSNLNHRSVYQRAARLLAQRATHAHWRAPGC